MLGGNIVVLDEGRTLQTGATHATYRNPATVKVAEVFSDPPINFLPGRIQSKNALIGEGIQMPVEVGKHHLTDGDYTFGIRSNHFFLSRTSANDAQIQARVELAEINGSETFIHFNHADLRLVAQEDGIFPHRIGKAVTLYVNPRCLFVFDLKGDLVAAPDLDQLQKQPA